jgi:hypothetical protein
MPRAHTYHHTPNRRLRYTPLRRCCLTPARRVGVNAPPAGAIAPVTGQAIGGHMAGVPASGGQPRGIARHAPSAGPLTACCWLSSGAPALPRRHRRHLTRAAPQRHLVAEHAPPHHSPPRTGCAQFRLTSSPTKTGPARGGAPGRGRCSCDSVRTRCSYFSSRPSPRSSGIWRAWGLLRDGHDRDEPLRAGGQAPIRSRGQRGNGIRSGRQIG